MKKKITIYSTPTCSHCQVAGDWFRENGFKYREIDISKDEQSKNLIQEKTGMMAVPVIQIDEDFVLGFNKPQIQGILGIKPS